MQQLQENDMYPRIYSYLLFFFYIVLQKRNVSTCFLFVMILCKLHIEQHTLSVTFH